MPDSLTWLASPTVWAWVGFHLFVIAMLALDLGVLQRKAHAVTIKEAAVWSAVWIGLAFVFAGGVWLLKDQETALQFVTAYLIEESLSVDNLFVFLVIFKYFAVPPEYQHRILFWGIVGAAVMRAAFILAGTALLHQFHWMIYFFGALLLYTSFKLLRSVESEIDPGRNPLLRLARRVVPLIDTYDSPKFWVKRDGRWHATPLILVLIVVESTDVVFAIDSVPAVLGIVPDNAFIAYTSNIFAILGLRSLFFLLAGLLGKLRYLNYGLALVLAFVGVKMILEQPLEPWLHAHGIHKEQLILISLGVIGTILAASVVASLLAPPKPVELVLHIEHPPEAAATGDQPPPDGAAPAPDKGKPGSGV